MKYMALQAYNNVQSQTRTIICNPNGTDRALKIVLKYRESVSKWFATVYDINKGTCLLANVPLATSHTMVNDLFKQFRHLGLGSCWVAAKNAQQSCEDPLLFNIEDYEIILGDTFVQSGE